MSQRLDAIDAFTSEARAASILAGLSFTPEEIYKYLSRMIEDVNCAGLCAIHRA